MKAYLECIPCILNQTAGLLKKTDLNEAEQELIYKEAMKLLSEQDVARNTPPALTQVVHDYLKQVLNKEDLYLEEKRVCNEEALKLYPAAEKIYQESAHKLTTALKLAVAGNLIDYGALSSFNVNDILDDLMHRPFAINDSKELLALLKQPAKLLYIGDNAGEIVFDKILVREFLDFGHEVIFAVKSKPILNDVLMAEAKMVSMTSLTKVIESGSTTAGTLLEEASPEFSAALDWADIILAKGQGNLETLSEEEFSKPLFYLLLSKCPHISKDLKVNRFDLLFLSAERFKSEIK
jgi:damage-control phosphatase, subfamily I